MVTTVAYVTARSPEEIDRVDRVVRAVGAPLRLTGLALVNRELEQRFRPDFLTGAALGVIGVAVLLAIGFGRLHLVPLALIPTVLGLLWSVGILSMAGVSLDLFSAFALLASIGIGVDYSVHVLYRRLTRPEAGMLGAITDVTPALLARGSDGDCRVRVARNLELCTVAAVRARQRADDRELPRHLDRRAPGASARSTMTVWALIAAFNEAPSIARVVTGVRPHVASVLVVDDGSTDGTAEAAAAAGASVIRHQVNRGKGAAIRTGLATVLDTDATHVLLLDGDGQHEPADAPALIKAARCGGVDFVLGERPFDRASMPRSRYWTNRISSRVISRYFVGADVGDAQSGYRLIATDLLATPAVVRSRLRDRDRDAHQGGPARRAARARAHQPALRRRGEQAPALARHHAHVLSGGTVPLFPGAAPVTEPARPPRWHPRGLNNEWIVGATYAGVSRLPTWLTYRIGHVGTWLAYRLQRQGSRGLVDNFRGVFPEMPERGIAATRPADLSQLRARHDRLHAQSRGAG